MNQADIANQVEDIFSQFNAPFQPIDQQPARIDIPAVSSPVKENASFDFMSSTGADMLPSVIVPSSPSVFEMRRASTFTSSPLSSPMSSTFPSDGRNSFSENDSSMMMLSAYPSPPGQYQDMSNFYPRKSNSVSSLPALTPMSPRDSDKESNSDTEEKKLHPCPHPGCNRKFTRLYNVKSHMVCHSGDRPHLCSDCPASFRRKHDLQRHFRTTHSNERPWVCSKCNRSFARRDHYRRHLQVEEVMESRRNEAIAGMNNAVGQSMMSMPLAF